MYSKQTTKACVTTWKQFSNKGYSAFASLGRQVRIGVLSVATLGVAAQAEATLNQNPILFIEDTEDDKGQTIDEVTISGTMAPLTQLQSARIVTVLTRQDIEKAGVQSVNDLFKLATGVDVRQRGGFGIQTDISIDGGTFDQITLLLNGVNISNPHTGHLAADFPVNIDDIERIEILEGAASRVYGGNAFGGAINIVTRHDKGNSLNVGAQGGSFRTVDADARLNLTFGNVANRISGGGGRSDGGTTNSDWQKGQIYYQGDFSHQDFDIDWQFGFSKKAYGANTFYSASYPDQYERNERYLISAKAETKGKVHLTPQVYWNRTYDNFELIHRQTFGENFHQTDVYGAGIGGYFNWWGGRTAAGAELRQEGILSTSLGHDLEEAQYVDVRGEENTHYTRHDNRTNVSYNVEHNILLDRWTVSAGILINMNTCVDHKYRFYPGIDITYRPADSWKIYASYNKGFRFPSFTDLYYKSPTHNGNAGLRPEENRSTQLGATYHHSGLTGTLRGFYHRGQRMIDWVMYTSSDTYHSANFNLDNMGFQAQVGLDFNELVGRDLWLQSFDLGYTWMHQTRHDDIEIFRSNYAMEYLRHKFVANLNHRIWNNLSATWSLRWQDRMGNYILYGDNYID
ncbi:MAG: TonB-dependent receptor, partial [Bacteroidaceae bacterium]|nr:TonB-dependent receptor [Bacteroidaceae bacterium]